MAENREVEYIIQELLPALRKYHVKKAVLFGSYAKGNATPNSDTDLLVVGIERHQ